MFVHVTLFTNLATDIISSIFPYHIIFNYRKGTVQYSAGTSLLAPQGITEKPMEVYYLDE